MAKFGCPLRFIAMVRQFHDGIQDDGDYPEPFQVIGIKQGCVMAPTLFSILFFAMLMDADPDFATVFPIRYRFDGKLFKPKKFARQI